MVLNVFINLDTNLLILDFGHSLGWTSENENTNQLIKCSRGKLDNFSTIIKLPKIQSVYRPVQILHVTGVATGIGRDLENCLPIT